MPLRNIKVYTTHIHACGYLEGQKASTLFIDPDEPVSLELYSHLSQNGFRRSGNHLYRPHCGHCRACIPSRVLVEEFKRSKSQLRVWRRNQDLTVQESESIFDDEAWALYCCYIEGRHADGEMFPSDYNQYQSFLNNSFGCTRYFRFYRDDEGRNKHLIMVMVVDEVLDGLSAIYTFYEPNEGRRSLGTYAVLYQIELCQIIGLPYVYLGYWIKNCNKMNYKTRFKPLELLQENGWKHQEKLPCE